MCGIAGMLSVRHQEINLTDLERVIASLRHRGPDDRGFLLASWGTNKVQESIEAGELRSFCEKNHPNLWMGHQRLSIIDLSPAGHQPMRNENGQVWIVYNGEIYNYLEIRKELEGFGHRFQSQTDTEVVLHAYEEWGTDCLRHFNGMWAFSIADFERKRIFCSRDRAGVKPFYYTYDGKRFCFASEIKALLAMEGFSAVPNEQMMADYLFSGLIDHTQETFFKSISQLRPGEYLLLEENQLTVRSYWEPEPREICFARDEEYRDRFLELLKDSIRLRLRSDVPIGSCLSGGLDSSSIVCLGNKLMFDGQSIDSKLVGERQKTFSSCFNDLSYDERKFIEPVIGRTGAEKNYVFPEAMALFDDLNKLMWHQDEPFGSTSIYAQWNVMKIAKERGVKVLLDGQGGDELLAGYPPSFYYRFSGALKQGDLPCLMREIRGFRKYHGNRADQFLPKMLAAILPDPIKLLARKFMTGDVGWADRDFSKSYFRSFPRTVKFSDDLNNYLYHIFRYMILPGLLHYEDRNSMAFSLETRLPFLDYRLVEFAFSLPVEQKIREGVTKVVLRNAMKGVLPEEIRNRMDKMGFVTPEDIWFRTTLREKIIEIINSESFASRGLFDVNKVKTSFDEHCEGKKNIGATIWRWVNLELWFRMFIDGRDWKDYGQAA